MSWDVNPVLTSEVFRALQHHSNRRSAEEGSGDMNAAVITYSDEYRTELDDSTLNRSTDRPIDRPIDQR
jgi:hypothetical protein